MPSPSDYMRAKITVPAAGMSSADWDGVDPDIRERSYWTAREGCYARVQGFRDRCQGIVDGNLSEADALREVRCCAPPATSRSRARRVLSRTSTPTPASVSSWTPTSPWSGNGPTGTPCWGRWPIPPSAWCVSATAASPGTGTPAGGRRRPPSTTRAWLPTAPTSRC